MFEEVFVIGFCHAWGGSTWDVDTEEWEVTKHEL